MKERCLKSQKEWTVPHLMRVMVSSRRGTAQFERTGIVMVAGGLGERLGFDGIKIDIPVESIEQTSYLAHYASVILAMEARMQQPRKMPFIIMVLLTPKWLHNR